MIQNLEDMLKACAMDFFGSWDPYFPLVEFAYNNSYHSSIDITPYEALYSRKLDPFCLGRKQMRENL